VAGRGQPAGNGRPRRAPAIRASALVQAHRYRARPLSFLDRARRELGETFAIRLPGIGEAVVVSDAQSVKRLFSADQVNAIAREAAAGGMLGPRSLIHQTGEEHLRRRRLMAPAFHAEGVGVHQATIAEATKQEVESWPEGEPLRLHPAMRNISLQVILRVVFGIQDPARREVLRERIVAALTAPTVPPAGPLDPILRALPPYRDYPRKIARIHELLQVEIDERRREPGLGDRADILSTLTQARFEDGSRMDDEELRDQLAALLLAGHDSISSTLGWCFDYLLHDERALERLLAELGCDDDRYLDAVLEETLRLRPPAPLAGRRLLEDAELGGYHVDANATIFVAIYLTNTSPETYTEPDAFRPERFLNGGPKTFSWIPFGGGTRRCIGGPFSMLEMGTVVRTVLEAVTLEPGRPELDVATLPNITIRPIHGVQAIVAARR
jgi:cytochrome P450